MRITILEMARAWFQGDAGPGGNELFLDAKPGTDDPTKFRQGNHTPGLIFGVQSGDFLQDRGPNDPPRRLEKVLVTTGPNDAPTRQLDERLNADMDDLSRATDAQASAHASAHASDTVKWRGRGQAGI